MYHNSEISIINLSRLQCLVSVLELILADNFSTNTCIGSISKKWYWSICIKLYITFASTEFVNHVLFTLTVHRVLLP